jgi:hypothetical protein
LRKRVDLLKITTTANNRILCLNKINFEEFFSVLPDNYKFAVALERSLLSSRLRRASAGQAVGYLTSIATRI